MRAYKRRKLEDLAGELEQAVSRNQVQSTYAMVKRLAPGPGTAQSHSTPERWIINVGP